MWNRNVKLALKRCVYRIARLRFGFDPWHYRVVRENCGYFQATLSMHRVLQASVTIEAGCGLGEILSGLRSDLRIGLDQDRNVIRAARLIRGGHIEFFHADEPWMETLEKVPSGTRCLICLNWLHGLESGTALNVVTGYAVAAQAHYVLHDVIDQGISGYRFCHDAEMLSSLGVVEKITPGGDGIRRLVLVRVRQ
jgi:hypothetical protein